MGARLNAAQARAVAHREGPLLVLAGAGTGKTRVIVHRMARLLAEGTPGREILALTFTQKAAAEMRQRLAGMSGDLAGEVTLSTFHALGLSILRDDPRAAGLAPGFAIYDTHDQLSLVRDLLRRVKVATRRLDPVRLLEIFAAHKARGAESVAIDSGDDYEMAAYDLYPRYLEEMRAFNAIDFDDLIGASSRALAAPGPGARWRQRWRWLLVDEYQDTSHDQLALVRQLCPPPHNIFAVGDDDQAIYGWRGAAVDGIFDFGRHFPGADELALEENYRSGGYILEAANRVVAENSRRRPKALRTERGAGEPVSVVSCIDAEDEARCVAELVAEACEGAAPAHSCAILTRARAGQDVIEAALVDANIPHQVGGARAFYDRKEVRDVLALMAFAHDPADDGALRRIVNVPPRGLGPATVLALVARAERQGTTLFAAVAALAAGQEAPPAASEGAAARGAQAAATRGARQLVAAGAGLAALRAARGARAEEALRRLVDELGLVASITAGGDSEAVAARRRDSLEAVVASWGRFARRHHGASAPLGAFVRAHVRHRADGEPASPAGVVVMTLHAAKGLEFDLVVMSGVEEELLPHRRALDEGGVEEERRLCHVGMTRARKRLVLTHARRRGSVGRATQAHPSRFLVDLPSGPGVVRRERHEDDDERVARADQAAQAFFAEMRDKFGLDMDMPVRGAGRR